MPARSVFVADLDWSGRMSIWSGKEQHNIQILGGNQLSWQHSCVSQVYKYVGSLYNVSGMTTSCSAVMVNMYYLSLMLQV